MKLAGDDGKTGRLDLDAGLGGTALFGKQKAQVSGHLHGTHMQGQVVSLIGAFSTLYDTSLNPPPRDKRVTVPGLRANLGLSYSTGGVKISGGYRIERYYNAIDGGLEERKQYDRSFDGPYMKVSIGFGG